MPKISIDFAGPSYFGGREDQLVLCAAKSGDIHIWDRDSGALLHHIRGSTAGGDLTCIAWNIAWDNPFMFATGNHDGMVKIWTTPTFSSPSIPAPSSVVPSIEVRAASPVTSLPPATHSLSGFLAPLPRSTSSQIIALSADRPSGSALSGIGNMTRLPEVSIADSLTREASIDDSALAGNLDPLTRFKRAVNLVLSGRLPRATPKPSPQPSPAPSVVHLSVENGGDASSLAPSMVDVSSDRMVSSSSYSLGMAYNPPV
jgi:hypothetical protein